MPTITLVVDMHERWPRSLEMDVDANMPVAELKERALRAIGPHASADKVRLSLKGTGWLPADAATVSASGIVDGSVVEAHRDRGLVVEVTLLPGTHMSVDDCHADTEVATVADRIAEAEGLPRGGFLVHSWGGPAPVVRWERRKTLRDYGATNETRHMACRISRARFVAEEAYAAAIKQGLSIDLAEAAMLEAHAASEAREAERRAAKEAEIAAMKATRAAAAAVAGGGAPAATPADAAIGGAAAVAAEASAAPSAAAGGAGSSL